MNSSKLVAVAMDDGRQSQQRLWMHTKVGDDLLVIIDTWARPLTPTRTRRYTTVALAAGS